MARLFSSATNEYLYTDSPPVTAAPFTLACWFYATNIVTTYALMYLGDQDNTTDYWYVMADGVAAGNPLSFIAKATTAGVALTTTGFSASTWHHMAAVAIASNNRWVYIDGGSGGQNTDDKSPAGADHVSIARFGGSTPGFYLNGAIAEAAIWDTNLNTAEVAALSKGVSPLTIRSGNLVLYIPLVRDNDFDVVGGLSLTAVNTPSITTHPPQLMGRLSSRIPLITGGGPGPGVPNRHRSKYGLLQGRIVLS